MNVDLLKDMDQAVFTNVRDNEGMELLSNEEIAARLLECDNILPY